MGWRTLFFDSNHPTMHCCQHRHALGACLLVFLCLSTHHVGAFRPASEQRVIANSKPRPPMPKKVVQSSVSADSLVSERVIIARRTRRDETSPQIAVPPPSVPLVQLALAGAVTTFFADTCIHPIDCIKTLQQSDLGAEMSFSNAARHLWQTAGLSGFCSGLLTYALADGMGGAIKFSVWESWKQKFPQCVWIGAALAFVAASVVVVPGEFLKQQLQQAHFDSLAEAAMDVYRNHGVGGFYLGYDAVILRDVPHTMMELCLYDVFKRAGTALPTNGNGSETHPVMAACLTGCVAGFLTTPMDAIKTKVMTVDGAYDGLWDCMATTLDSYGWSGMWAGALARVLWIAPFSMLYLPTYDFLHKQLLERHMHLSDFQHSHDVLPLEFDIDDE